MNETSQQPVKEMVAVGNETLQQPSEEFFARLVGINEAAAVTGRSKGQISRDTNTKRLPHTLNEKGQKRYKVADLFQQYGFKQPKETIKEEHKKPEENNAETTKTAVELAVLQERLRAQAETMRRMEQEITDLRQSRDRLLDQNNRLTMLLPAPNVPSTPLAINEPEPSPRQPFWKRLFS